VTVELPPFDCPAEMVKVGGAFCVDVYEASRPDATTISAGTDVTRAVSRPGVLPWQTEAPAEAEAACEAAGKRLCAPAEWELACRGSAGTVYGYGQHYQAQTCNGLDAFGPGQHHLAPTGSFPGCRSDWGAADLNGNLWEYTLGGDATTVRGGAFNCSDSPTFHRCDYVPGGWKPVSKGFRCCWAPAGAADPEPEAAEGLPEGVVEAPAEVVAEVAEGEAQGGPEAPLPECIVDDAGLPDAALAETVAEPGAETVAEPGAETVAEPGPEVVAPPCPPDMVPVGSAWCFDRWEASRPDASAVQGGADGSRAFSREGVIPWFPVEYAEARAACEAAGKRLCTEAEWYAACAGTAGHVYVYGDQYSPDTCNGIDAFCNCGGPACEDAPACPFPHCYNQADSSGFGPCGASFHVAPTGSFPACVDEYGALDVNGNVWELVDLGDGQSHYKGGAYNCGDSEFLHQCSNLFGTSVSARGFRCCRDQGAR
jgi:formylglycine-generating enzyme required for sulfatase activity